MSLEDRAEPRPTEWVRDIVLSLDIPRTLADWAWIIRRQTRPFANFVREAGTLIIMTGVFGALSEKYPSNGTRALFWLAYAATLAMLLNTVGLRMRFQFTAEEPSPRPRFDLIVNVIVFTIWWFVINGWISEVRTALISQNLGAGAISSSVMHGGLAPPHP